MKILKSNIESTIKNFEKYKCFLLYGDANVVSARMQEVKNNLASKELISIDLTEGKEMRDVFTECFTPSFFNSSKLIYIIGTDSTLSDIEDIIEKVNEHFLLICVYENLDTKSKIRKFAESNASVATIACYKDEEYDMVNIINQFCKTHNIIIEKDATLFIAKKFNNRSTLILELEKLKSYKKNNNITFEDVKKVTDEVEESNLFEAINLLFSNKKLEYLNELEKLEEEGLPPSILALNITNYILKLIDILEEKETKGKGFEEILNERKTFFKQIPIMKDHLSRFNLNTIHDLLAKSIVLEIEVRRNPVFKYNKLKSFEVF